MYLFAHVGITLGSAWILQKTASHFKHKLSGQKLNCVASNSLGDHTLEASSNMGSTTNWFDYRFLLLGSLLPDIIDKPLGIAFLDNGRTFCHTLLFTLLILAAGVYLLLVWKRSGLFCVALGCVTHILLDTMWLDQRTFLWPLFGWSFEHHEISVIPWMERTLYNLITKPSEYISEVIGAVSLVFFYFNFNLKRRGKISRLLKSWLSILYRNLFKERTQKHMFTGFVLSKEE